MTSRRGECMPGCGARRGRVQVRVARRAGRVVAALALLALPAVQASASYPFRIGEELLGLIDLSAAYGLLVRTETRDEDLVGIGNGGHLPSVNIDDGNLNYAPGVVANQIRGTAELTLVWRDFGAVVRGYGFYDFENQLSERGHRPLSADAQWLVGAGAELQDAYLSARFEPGGVPVLLRAGEQVVNWGDSGFLRFGVDVVNPVDFVALSQPTATGRDVFVRQGMLWGAANLTETIAVEAFYQYRWEPVRLNPTGAFFSSNDLIGGDGMNAAVEGAGRYSDLGTDLDSEFGLPPGSSEGGFDPRFMHYLSGGRYEPSDQGQFGVAIQAFLPELNTTKLALHFVNYHSRFPLISGFTASQGLIDTTSDGDVDLRAAALSLETGLPPVQTRFIAEQLTISDVANETLYFATYPENIKMLGLSFNTATIDTGTLITGEVSHQFDWPVQLPAEEVLAASLSPIEFTSASTAGFQGTSLGVFGAEERVRGFERVGRTQLSLGVAQLLGPRLGAAQAVVSLDVGWIHIHDLPDMRVFDADSVGYRFIAQLTYDGVFGGLSIRPRVVWTHDVEGVTPSPAGAFIEDRMSLTAAFDVNFTNTWTLDLGYTAIFGGEPNNPGVDRDFVRFNLIYHY